MIKLTIRIKIMLWYTLLLLLLLGLFIPAGYHFVAQSVYRNEESLLKTDAIQVLSTVEVENNSLEIDGAASFFTSGTLVFIYDLNNDLIYNNSDQTWLMELPPDYGGARTVKDGRGGRWLVYDREILDNDHVIARIKAARSLKPAENNLRNLETLILIGLPIYILIAMSGGLFIASRALAPIDRINKVAHQIGQGDLTKRIKLPYTGDEVGRLAGTFDEMLEKLEAAFNREKHFAADASHELRTPLAVILAHAEEALTGKKSLADFRESMKIIEKESKKMRRMVSQLLMLTRGYEDQRRFKMEEINLSVIVRDIADEMAEYARKSGIEILVSADDDIKINADQALITQMLINLIENAIKYNKQGGWIKLRLIKEKDYTGIIVEDNGIGISKEDLPNIFNRFYRADRSRTSEGTGLGLSIVKWIVEAHRGSIQVNSTLDKGTIFEIRLSKIMLNNHASQTLSLD